MDAAHTARESFIRMTRSNANGARVLERLVFQLGLVSLMFSSLGNWGYTYRAHQKYGQPAQKSAADILNERYARGELNREEYGVLKADIAAR